MWLSHIIFQKHVADPTILKKKLWFLLFEVYLFVTASVCNLGHEQRLHVAGVSVVDIVTKQIYMNEFTALIMHCIRSSISNGFNLSLQWRQWLSNFSQAATSLPPFPCASIPLQARTHFLQLPTANWHPKHIILHCFVKEAFGPKHQI